MFKRINTSVLRRINALIALLLFTMILACSCMHAPIETQGNVESMVEDVIVEGTTETEDTTMKGTVEGTITESTATEDTIAEDTTVVESTVTENTISPYYINTKPYIEYPIVAITAYVSPTDTEIVEVYNKYYLPELYYNFTYVDMYDKTHTVHDYRNINYGTTKVCISDDGTDKFVITIDEYGTLYQWLHLTEETLVGLIYENILVGK